MLGRVLKGWDLGGGVAASLRRKTSNFLRMCGQNLFLTCSVCRCAEGVVLVKHTSAPHVDAD